jgi:hypothetical protein
VADGEESAGGAPFRFRAEKVEPPGALRVPEAIAAEDFLRLELPPRRTLLSPWLPEKGLAMIAAPRGLGKTHLALGVAFAVASGGSFLRWQSPEPRRVIYIDGEMPAIAMQERLARVAATTGGKSPPAGFLRFMMSDLSETGIPDLSSREGFAAMRPHLADADLIVLDNLSTLCRSGRENESESWVSMQEFLLDLRRAGQSVLLIHHTGKGGQQRGTSKREDILDSILLLKRPDDYDAKQGARFVVTFDKARGFHGADAEAFTASLDPHTGLWTCETLVDVRDAEIRELAAAGMSQRDIANAVGVGLATVNRKLRASK